MADLSPGLIGQSRTTVTQENTAQRLGSGSLAVFATPALVGLMEQAAVQALEGHLPPGKTTVGGHIDLRHLAPTPVWVHVNARAELIEVAGRRLVFHIQAWDEAEKIGQAHHVRYIIDADAFIAQAQAKV